MPIDVDISRAPRLIRIVLREPWPTIEEQSELRKRFVSGGIVTADTCALIDVRHLHTKPQFEQMMSSVSAAMDDASVPLRRAYLAGSSMQFGFARQMQSLLPPEVVSEIFTDEAAALAWLLPPG